MTQKQGVSAGEGPVRMAAVFNLPLDGDGLVVEDCFRNPVFLSGQWAYAYNDAECRAAAALAINSHDRDQELIAELVEALEPFARVAEHDIGESQSDADLFHPMEFFNSAPRLTVGDLRRALAALAKAEGRT